ncbi:Hpt domain-containing protein [Thalassovita sp.]|uniref:Hpt domain-containing protein n=1 Tax=Thalassovita sp. TaxID=1979401 RepID=UPI0028810B51|nr:Hpt domain-containing protein [Thalassovita sp.]MDF1802206.1 Hpt domain-containing protein [Thalassovita sp.]
MIDWDRVAELRDQIGAEDFDEVVELFLDEVMEVIEKLRNDPENQDLEAELHFLKGSALNLGFADFSEKCHAGERHAANGQSELIELQAILDSFDASRHLFLEELEARFAA